MFESGGFMYFLVCADTFNSMCYARPLQDKTQASVIAAFESIFEQARYTPIEIQFDQGKEFTGGE